MMRIMKMELALLVGLLALGSADGFDDTRDILPDDEHKDLLDLIPDEGSKDLIGGGDDDGDGHSNVIDLRALITPPMTRIVGGSLVSESANYRWMVSLQRGSSNFPFCGGSLISPTFVLTAGHCVASSSPDRVVIGNYDLGKKSAGTIRTIKKVIRHPNYSGVTNDVALLELSSPVTDIEPVYISRNVFEAPQEADDQMLTVIGWGYTEEGSGQVQTKLRTVDVPVVSQTRCRKSYSPIDSTKICAGYDEAGQDSCSGDSGGPLFFTNPASGQITQVGVTSYGRGCARAKYYGVYARPSAFLDFIMDTLEDNGSQLSEVVTAPTTSAPSQSPTPAPTDYVPGSEEEQDLWDFCLTNKKNKCSSAVRRPMCFWNNLNQDQAPGFPPLSCLPTYILPTQAPTPPTPAPTAFEPVTNTELQNEMNACSTTKSNKCRQRADRCFWNPKSNGFLRVSYLSNRCLPHFFKSMFEIGPDNRT